MFTLLFAFGGTPVGILLGVGLVCASLLGIAWHREFTWRSASMFVLADLIFLPLMLILGSDPSAPGCVRPYPSLESWAWGTGWRVVVYAVCVGLALGLLRGDSIRYVWLQRRQIRLALALLTTAGLLIVVIGDIYVAVGVHLFQKPLEALPVLLFLGLVLPVYFLPLANVLVYGWGGRGPLQRSDGSHTMTIQLGSPHRVRP